MFYILSIGFRVCLCWGQGVGGLSGVISAWLADRWMAVRLPTISGLRGRHLLPERPGDAEPALTLATGSDFSLLAWSRSFPASCHLALGP